LTRASETKPKFHVRYHCSETASGTYAVLFMAIKRQDGSNYATATRLSGMLPAYECHNRALSFAKEFEILPSSNYFCEVDASGSATLYQQVLKTGEALSVATKQISKALSRWECNAAAEAKHEAAGRRWTAS
jgi:hypothetical protein